MKPSQMYMFDLEEPPQDANPLVFKEPSDATLRATISILDRNYTKAYLVDMCQMLHPMLKGHTSLKKRTASGEIVGAGDLAPLTNGNAPKAKIEYALAFIFSESENLRHYINILSDEMRELWRRVLVRMYLPMEEVRSVLKTTDTLSPQETHQNYYYSYQELSSWKRRELQWFRIVNRQGKTRSSWGSREQARYLTITPFFHRIFLPIFYPDIQADHSLAELPEGEFRIVSGEVSALKGYPVMAAMLAGGELSLSSGRYLIAGQKVAQKRLNIDEFGIGETEGMHSALYVQLLTLHHFYIRGGAQPIANQSSYEKIVTDLLRNIGRFHHYMPLFIFTHIKGLTKDVISENLCSILAVRDCQLLKEHPLSWIPIQDFFMSSIQIAGTTDVPFPPLVFSTRLDDYRMDIVNKYTGESLTVADYTSHFGFTFHQGLLYALAALGVVELACSPTGQYPVLVGDETQEHPQPLSPYAAIVYARLTPLGQYALGVIAEYGAPQTEKQELFQLDDQYLIIRDLTAGKDNPYLEILRDISRHIGASRYEVTSQTFLAPCSNRDDVEQRIQNFHRFICPKPPQHWQDFFEQLLSHCNPLTPSRQSFHLYIIPEDNHELQRLIATDSQLRQLVIRAEGFRILVSTTDLTKFCSRLKALGYLL